MSLSTQTRTDLAREQLVAALGKLELTQQTMPRDGEFPYAKWSGCLEAWSFSALLSVRTALGYLNSEEAG